MNSVFHISRKGKVIGLFSLAGVRHGIAVGAIQRTDHYWSVGMKNWLPVGSDFDEAATSGSALRPSSKVPPPAGVAPNAAAVAKSSSVRKIAWGCILMFSANFVFQFATLQMPVDKKLATDSRNAGIRVSCHHANWLPWGDLVIDVKEVGEDARPADMLRVLLQCAEVHQTVRCDWVILASEGAEKYKIRGPYFRKLGEEYGDQNPLYTMRTLPGNVHRMNGSPAFPSSDDDSLAAMAAQMKSNSEFITGWLSGRAY